MSSQSEMRQKLENALEVGRILVATIEQQPSLDGPSIGLTVTIRRGARLKYLLILDRYRMDPPFGTDLDHQMLSFDSLGDLLERVISCGIDLSKFKILYS